MSWLINNTEINLSIPINKYWYSKHKKQLLKKCTALIEYVINDAKSNRKIIYNTKYYACAKFIKHTTNLKFIKKQKYIYYVIVYNDDFADKYLVENANNFKCLKKIINLTI